MQSYSLTHVSDAALLRDLAALVVRDRLTMAEILAHIAGSTSGVCMLRLAIPRCTRIASRICACRRMRRSSESRQQGRHGGFRSSSLPSRMAGFN